MNKLMNLSKKTKNIS